MAPFQNKLKPFLNFLVMIAANALLFSLVFVGCSKNEKEETTAGPKSTVPTDTTNAVASTAANPQDSAVKIKFLGFSGTGVLGKEVLRLEISNPKSSAITQIEMIYGYLDAAGKEIKQFPMSKSYSPHLVPAKTTITGVVGGMAPFVPPNTVSVSVTIKKVTFADGTTWAP